MAQAQIATQKILAGNLTAGQTSVAVLGTTAGGGTVYSLDANTQQNTQWLNGVNNNVIVQNPNPGSVPIYSPTTTYSVNQYAKDSTTQLVYISLINGNLGNPFTDGAAWKNVNYQFFPYQETINSIGNVLSNNIAAGQQEGILPYLVTTSYNQYAIVKNPGTAQLYQSLIPTNLGNPLTNTAAWAFLVDLSDVNNISPLPSGQDCNNLGLSGPYGTFGLSSGAAATLINGPSAPEIFTTLQAGILINQKIPYSNLATNPNNYYIQQFYIVNFPQNTPQIIFRRFYYAATINLWDGWETSGLQSLGVLLSGTDLNICVNNGFYAITTGIATSIINFPSGINSGAWQLECRRIFDKTTTPATSYTIQTLTSLITSGPLRNLVYERVNPGNVTTGWGAWQLTSPLPTPASQSDILEGTDNIKYVTSSGLAQNKSFIQCFLNQGSATTSYQIASFSNTISNANMSTFFTIPSLGSGIVNIATAGQYKITLRPYWVERTTTINDSTNALITSIFYNTSTIILQSAITPTLPSAIGLNTITADNVETFMQLNPGDQLQCQYFYNAGGGSPMVFFSNTNPTSYFCVEYIGPL